MATRVEWENLSRETCKASLKLGCCECCSRWMCGAWLHLLTPSQDCKLVTLTFWRDDDSCGFLEPFSTPQSHSQSVCSVHWSLLLWEANKRNLASHRIKTQKHTRHTSFQFGAEQKTQICALQISLLGRRTSWLLRRSALKGKLIDTALRTPSICLEA